MTAKNICKHCGGSLVIEYFGEYGDIYKLKKNGEECKKRLKRVVYGSNDENMIYCIKCGAKE